MPDSPLRPEDLLVSYSSQILNGYTHTLYESPPMPDDYLTFSVEHGIPLLTIPTP